MSSPFRRTQDTCKARERDRETAKCQFIVGWGEVRQKLSFPCIVPHRLSPQVIHAAVQINVVAELRGDVDNGDGVLEKGIWFMGGGLHVVLQILLDGRVREWGGELLPETLGNRIKGIAIPRFQNCNERESGAERGIP